MNILIVNCGRHISRYDQIVESVGNGTVHIAENSLDAPSCILNKSGGNFQIPRAYEDHFIDELLGICSQNDIDYLFSFFDNDWPLLAKAKDTFEAIGTKVVISDYQTVKICEDKLSFFEHLFAKGLSVVPTFSDISILNECSFPLFAKPRYGHGSQGAQTINNPSELEYYLGLNNYIFQPFMSGKEFGVDLLVKNKQIYDIFMKEKLAMRAGTTDKAVSVWCDELYELVCKLTSIFNFDGPIDIDIFKISDKYYINEVNPKVGGGYPTAIACGKNFFSCYLHDLKNPDFSNYSTNVKTVRYEQTIIAPF